MVAKEQKEIILPSEAVRRYGDALTKSQELFINGNIGSATAKGITVIYEGSMNTHWVKVSENIVIKPPHKR